MSAAADDLEDWLIETGDDVIRKMTAAGPGSLGALETATYHLWVIDYAVRNSGTLGPMEELCPDAAKRLLEFSSTPCLSALSQWLVGMDEDTDILDDYLERFPQACLELQRMHVQSPGSA